MNLINTLSNLLKSNITENLSITPEGLCPNCWGIHEYGGKFYESVKNEPNHINKSNPNIGWIQDYVNKNLTDIKLQSTTQGIVCPNCAISLKEV